MTRTFELSDKAEEVVMKKWVMMTRKRREKVNYKDAIDVLLGVKPEG